MTELIKGGAFLLGEQNPEQIFSPEDVTEDQWMFARTTDNFAKNRLETLAEELEHQPEGLMAGLLKEAGDLGLLAADVPEAYGGYELDKVSSLLITERIVRGGSFAVSFSAHTGIGTLPIVFFGNEEQKQKYLPDLASGAKIAAYCLTEPGSGSDALGARTKAVLSEDGKHYILNGTKQYITNAAFADVFIVYAKIDGEHFTAFIVEKGFPGVSLGTEEKKMGIKGSSTRQVILENAQVPVENMLFEKGKGHVVAFNILNIGRYKLGVAAMGSAKLALEEAVSYALERKQFGLPIVSFGAIREKIAEMNTRIFILESVMYRIAGLFDSRLGLLDMSAADAGQLSAKAIEEYAVECSIAKVFGSEVLDYVVDEAVQIHGGYGYTQEYKVERFYRDSRINRLFEGTNEINRLLIPGTLIKRAAKGQLPLLAVAKGLLGELMQPMPALSEHEPLAREEEMLQRMKKATLMAAGSAAQKFGPKLEREQELLMRIADCVIDIYTVESGLLRAKKALNNLPNKTSIMTQMAGVYCQEVFLAMEVRLKELLAAIEEGDTLKTQLSMVKKLFKAQPVNIIELRRKIADEVTAKTGFAI